MKIYYVRHGQTDWNLARKMQGGQIERPLNETGLKQAEDTKKQLENIKYDIVICSPMQRAKQTAEIINEGRNVSIIIDERLRERKLGDLEGHPITEQCEKEIWDYKLNINLEGGENLQEFEQRVLEFITDIKRKYEEKTLLIVAHGGIAKILKAYLFDKPESQSLAEIGMKNCEILKINL